MVLSLLNEEDACLQIKFRVSSKLGFVEIASHLALRRPAEIVGCLD